MSTPQRAVTPVNAIAISVVSRASTAETLYVLKATAQPLPVTGRSAGDPGW